MKQRQLRLALAVLIAAVVLPNAPGLAKVAKFYSFKGSPVDGALPQGDMLLLGTQLYGTTEYGGSADSGVVYTIDPVSGTERVVYNFLGRADGEGPTGNLIYSSGYFYGTTFSGGSSGNGTIFRIEQKTGAHKVLYSFTGGNDGGQPQNGVSHVAGVLYGTTYYGGTAGNGTVFAFDLKTRAETVLHSFTGTPSGGGGTTDGGFPASSVTYVEGALYGTTQFGGTTGNGTIYKINVADGSETILAEYSGSPMGSLVEFKAGLYGTSNANGSGFIFRIDPGSGAVTEVYDFTNSREGVGPLGPVGLQAGVIYGSLSVGGAKDGDGAYQFKIRSGKAKPLASFGCDSGCIIPFGGLVAVSGGIFGLTEGGGKFGNGQIYMVVP